MKLVKALVLSLAVAGVALIVSGCGYRELSQRILIQGVGVDKLRQGYQVTVRAAGSGEEGEQELFTCQGETVLQALDSLSLSTGREPFYAHNYLVVFGRSCGEAGLADAMDFFIRYYNTRPGVQVFLAQDTAQQILSAQREDKLIPMGELQGLRESGPSSGQGVSVDFLEFVNASRRPGSSPVLPVLGEKEGRVSLVGTAYFQGEKLQGFLDLDQTRGYLALEGELKQGQLVVQGQDFGTVTLTISQGKASRKIAFDQRGDPVFQVNFQVTADVSSLSGERPRLEESFYAGVEQAVAETLQAEMKSALDQALDQDRCDIFGFGNLLSQQRPGVWESLADSWGEEMASCQYEIQVEATVLRMEQ